MRGQPTVEQRLQRYLVQAGPHGLTVAQMAARLGRAPSSFSNLLAKLIAQGKIRREVDRLWELRGRGYRYFATPTTCDTMESSLT